eukprot:6620511-Prymnesium_polylepis.1
MTLWAIVKSPLMFGGAATQLDAFTMGLLANREVLEMNAKSTDNRRVNSSSAHAVWAAKASGDWSYVGLFNRLASTTTLTTSFASLGLQSDQDYDSIDLWTGKTAVQSDGKVSVSVAPHGVALLKLAECAKSGRALLVERGGAR